MGSLRIVPAAILLLLALSSVFARDFEPLGLVPADAVTVGVIRLSELRSSPLASRIFSHCDRITTDGEAERFLRESGFNPIEDIDTVVISLSPKSGEAQEGDVLVAIQGRFDVDRLSSAIDRRGAVRVTTSDGIYYRLPRHEGEPDEHGALALVSSRLALAGEETAVAEALAALRRGGTDFIHAGGLAHLLGRIDPSASAWLLVDVPRSARLKGEADLPGKADRDPALRQALRNVSVVGVWAGDRGDQLRLGATAISNDAETLGLLEDLLRGLLAGWRLAAQEESPDLVSAIRRFEVDRGADSVTLSGSIAHDVLEKFVERSGKSYGK